MSDQPTELRSIRWSQVFPFVRLFHTFSLAISYNRLFLALLAVLALYFVGRILDPIWDGAGGGVRARILPVDVKPVTDLDLWAAGYQNFADIPAAARFPTTIAQALGAPRAAETEEQPGTVGPFQALLDFQGRAFSAAVQGAAQGNWLYGGGPLDPQPSVAGSVVAFAHGFLWFVVNRPFYAVVFGLVMFAIFAFVGLGICRHAAVQTARDETLTLKAVTDFARTKWLEAFLATIMPLGVIVLGAVLLGLGGLIGAIPWIGHMLSGLLWGLALLGGFVLALVLIGYTFGVHLMWPTIGVESSDAFDAITRSYGYVTQRLWNALWYAFVLLIYGALTFLMVRLIALVLLKLTHAFTGFGFTLFDNLTSAKSDLPKLDAIWAMPTWGELSLLPAARGMPFWGSFDVAELSGTEAVAQFFIAAWVFLVVSFVGAYVISFYFCGCTQIYFLLRRDVDATDWEDVYYEEEAVLGPAGEPTTNPLPVVSGEDAAAKPQASEDQPPADQPADDKPADEDESGHRPGEHA